MTWFFIVPVSLLLALGSEPVQDVAPEGPPPLVVLDAGHGGGNLGAPGPGGVHEKQVTLAVARKVEVRLRQRGFRVAMTRREDEYLTLRQRSALASQWNADRFVSIHANASPSSSHRGFETYVLSARAVADDAPALRPGPVASRPGTDIQVARILDDVERVAAQDGALRLAESIQGELRRLRGRALDRGVREQSMHVLLGATMPAVLVEIGFLSHPVEGPQLLDDSVQDGIADAIAAAIAADLQ